MIDTDKYEGHSEGEWYWSPEGLRCKTNLVYPSHRNVMWNGTPPHTPKDMELIADAPLILEAYKRLREAIKVATIDLEEPNMHEETRKDLLDMLKEMIE